MSVLNEFVLVLSKGWQPIDTITVRAAFGRLFSGNVFFMDEDDYSLHDVEAWLALPVTDERHLRTNHDKVRVPEVIVMRSGYSPDRNKLNFGRRNLLKRDRGTCQYCGEQPSNSKLTMDHVIPRSKGGPKSWQNCVLACLDCNGVKGDKSLAESGLKLIDRPELKTLHPDQPNLWKKIYEPNWSPVYKVPSKSMKQSWRKFVHEKDLMS